MLFLTYYFLIFIVFVKIQGCRINIKKEEIWKFLLNFIIMPYYLSQNQLGVWFLELLCLSLIIIRLLLGGPWVCLVICPSSTCWAAIASEIPTVAKKAIRRIPIFCFMQLHLHMLTGANFPILRGTLSMLIM